MSFPALAPLCDESDALSELLRGGSSLLLCGGLLEATEGEDALADTCTAPAALLFRCVEAEHPADCVRYGAGTYAAPLRRP